LIGVQATCTYHVNSQAVDPYGRWGDLESRKEKSARSWNKEESDVASGPSPSIKGATQKVGPRGKSGIGKKKL